MDKETAQPFSVTILSAFVLLITAWNGIRVYSAIANWQVLQEFGANPVYILVTGLFWVTTGLWLDRVLEKGYPIALYAGWSAASLYTAWYWCDRILIQPDPAPNTVFSLGVTFGLLMFYIICLNLPASKAYFKRSKDDRE